MKADMSSPTSSPVPHAASPSGGSGREFAGIGYAIALVGAALGVTLLLQNVVSTAGFVFFYTAVVVSTWYGGRWAGTLAVILACLTVEYFFMTPLHSFGVDRQELPVFVEFAASAAVVGWFSSWRKRAEIELSQARDELQTRVEERTADLRQANEQLLARDRGAQARRRSLL